MIERQTNAACDRLKTRSACAAALRCLLRPEGPQPGGHEVILALMVFDHCSLTSRLLSRAPNRSQNGIHLHLLTMELM